jgi:Zn-dependent M32 family carboxypeptidase
MFAWLRTNVYSVGAKMTIHELMKAATGKALGATSFVRYAENKYLEGAASSVAA